MTRLITLLAVGLSSQACVAVQDVDTTSLDASGVTLVTADMERGDVVLIGRRGAAAFDVEATVWGRGSSRDKATMRQDDVTWSADLQGDRVVLRENSDFTRAGVDFRIDGPDIYDTSLVVDSGSVRIEDVDGFHSIDASSVSGTLIGDMDILASSSVDINFIPWRSTHAIIESTGGSVVLAVPFGLDYDLTVRGSVSDEIIVSDLGFDRVDLGDGFFSGLRGRGDVAIDIIVDSGTVEVVELR